MTTELHQVDWAKVRATRFAPFVTPEDWPRTVRPISMNGLGLLGVDERNGDLYWDGTKVETTKRLATFERTLAILATAATVAVAAVEVARFCIERSA